MKKTSSFWNIKAFEKASSKKIPYEIVDRRPGDIPASYTDTTFAEKILFSQFFKDRF